MVFNKSLFASLLLTSSLVFISSAKAGFDGQGSFRLSVAKLKKGYEKGKIKLKDGRRFSVENKNPEYEPDFSMTWNDSAEIYGVPNFDYSTYKEDEHRFIMSVGGGPRHVQNPETGEWYYDYDQVEPGYDVFDLILRPIKEEKEIVETSSERVADLLSPSTSSSSPSPSPSSSPLPLPSSSSAPFTAEEGSSLTVGKASSAEILIEPSDFTNTAPHSFDEELLNHEPNLEERLTVLRELIFSSNPEDLLSTSVQVFNEYLNLKKHYEAPFLPQSFYVVESPQDLIAEFYALDLAKSVPYILNEETLNLNLKERLEFANRYKSDVLSGNSHASFEIPDSLITFYKNAATSKDDQLTNNEKFSAIEHLFKISGNQAKPFLISSLHDPETPFELKHKLAHLAKHASDTELQEEGHLFIDGNIEAIRTAARAHYDGLSVHSKIEIPPHLREAKLGEDIGVAVCDSGFFKVLPTSLWSSLDSHQLHLLKQYGEDSQSFAWNLLHGDRISLPYIHDSKWLSEVKNPLLPYHGSEMTDLVATVSPGAHIQPVIVDTNSSESLKAAFDHLAEDPTINIISCSFGLPADPNDTHLVNSDVKDSMLKCLRNNKIIVLGTTNNGATIPDMPEQPEDSSDLSSSTYSGGGLADIFFEHEVAYLPSRISSLFLGEDETSPLLSNLILVGSSKEDSLDLHERSVKPGNGPAQKQFVYADADNLKNFFDEVPTWGGTSAAAAMVSGVLADLWSQIKSPDGNTAARVSRCLFENTDIAADIPPSLRGRGKVNLTKALEELDEY